MSFIDWSILSKFCHISFTVYRMSYIFVKWLMSSCKQVTTSYVWVNWYNRLIVKFFVRYYQVGDSSCYFCLNYNLLNWCLHSYNIHSWNILTLMNHPLNDVVSFFLSKFENINRNRLYKRMINVVFRTMHSMGLECKLFSFMTHAWDLWLSLWAYKTRLNSSL